MQHDVLIIDGFRFTALIGNDALEIFGLDVSYSKCQLITKTGGMTPFEIAMISTPPTSFAITLMEDQVIPELSEVVVQGQIRCRNGLPNLPACGMVTAAPPSANDIGVLVARSLVQVAHDKTVSLKVCNPVAAPVPLSKGCHLAEFALIDPEDVIETLHTSSSVMSLQPSPHDVTVNVTEQDQNVSNSVEPDPAAIEWIKNMTFQGSQLLPTQQEELRRLLFKNVDVLSTSTEYMRAVNIVKHKINTGEHAPIKLRPYRVSRSEEESQAKEVESQLKAGIIRPSRSPWAFPVVMVKKRDGTLRFCVDYRKLNEVTKKDVYPLPHIHDTLDSLGGARYFTTLDMITGYWQVEISEEDREKTAFITKLGLFEYNRMPFGLTNAPATFQHLVDFLLEGMHWVNALDYLDDIVIYTKTFEEHLDALDSLFDRMRKIGLTAKITKCHFCEASLKFLGHVISKDGISVDSDKIKAVTSMRIPQDLHAVRRFLGLTTYYRRFIPSYAKIAEPLFRLLDKIDEYRWTENCQAAFDILKKHLVSAPILRYPDFKSRFILQTDASSFALGAILSQRDNQGEYVVSFASRTLSKAERNYSTTERECLAVIWGIAHFRPYLYGRPFDVVTDHHSLRWLMSIKDATGRLARWSLKLQAFDFNILHRSGKN
ncbi:MAG: reverse transcriptase/ribonuclease H family protein, partial [Candidatus Saccharimonadales bacterium]